MRPLTRALLVATTGAASLALVAGPALAATTLNPAKLTRGADPAVAHVEGGTLVDGAFRVTLKGERITLLGESGSAYVVAKAKRSGKATVVRVEADGTQRRLGNGDPYSTVLSSDGTSVVVTDYRRDSGVLLKVLDATSGAVRAQKSFKRSYPTPLDVSGTRVLLGSFDGGTRGTFAWDTTTGSLTKVSRRIGTRADVGLDLLVSYTKDPYSDGCTVVSRLSAPGVRLWKSCDDAVAAISPDGSHLATYDILTDGLGPRTVQVRTVTGTVTGDYKTKRTGYFGTLQFEDADTLLLETAADGRVATVRCTGTTCDRASELTKAVAYGPTS